MEKEYKYLLHVVYHATATKRSHYGEVLTLDHPITEKDITKYEKESGSSYLHVVGFSKFEDE